MNWEPWTGCYKVSDGCTYCYFYVPYSKRFGQNTIEKTADFSKPLAKTAKGDIGEKQGKIFSIDYLIGEPDYLRRGFGKEMIAKMLDMLRKVGAKTVIVEPERDNTASNRALEANGFIRIGEDYHLELGDEAKIILETQRLILREMTREDYPALAAILRDEQTMYAYEGAFTESETQAWLDMNLVRYHDGGIGLWTVVMKDSGLMIGQAGLTWQEVNGRHVPEVGYLFNRAYWGKGYAIEAAIACKNYGFNRLGFNEIYSIVRDTNIASMNVAIRNGMVIRERFSKHYRGVDMPHYAFVAKKASLQNKHDDVPADLLSGHKKIWGYYEYEKNRGRLSRQETSRTLRLCLWIRNIIKKNREADVFDYPERNKGAFECGCDYRKFLPVRG